jgi:hypothetical protein
LPYSIFGDYFDDGSGPAGAASYRPMPTATPSSLSLAQRFAGLAPQSSGSPTFAKAGSSATGPSTVNFTPLNGIGGTLAQSPNNHALTLMALGAGIAQGGVGRGLSLAQSAAEAERNLMAQQVNFRQTYEALTGAGVPNDEALAAVVNPSLMHALAVKYLGAKAPASAAAPASRPTPMQATSVTSPESTT